MIVIAAAAVYVAVGLVMSRWAWRSGGARRIANNIEDQPFSPGFVAFMVFAVWPIVAVLHFGGAAVRRFYGKAGR
ncbi:hypothetical protein A5755_10655 [Mycolicibacterium fortuitum]|nr:hypothetical protein A5754_29275 [Mycolicibacterium fortuitum]OBB77874.1 hypothetical protein A5755_10655 [Mycolicibacterium fortuitum]OBF89697.1 hypothetical protein A5751_00055 [Mycolicibacterium fortuitum]